MLLLISSNPHDIAFCTEIAKQAGLQFKHTSTALEGVQLIDQESPKAIFVDSSTDKQYQQFEQSVQDTLGLFTDKLNPNHLFYIRNEEGSSLQLFVQSPIFGHIMIRQQGAELPSAQHFARMVKFTLLDRAFGLVNFFGPQVRIQAVQIKKTTQKQDAVEAVKNFLIAAKFQSRMASLISNAVDEILMNAMFDAPVDEFGNQIFTQTSRASLLDLTGRHIIEMQIAFDGNYVGITVSDNWGSVNKSKLLTHISKVYTEDEYKVRTATTSAGIGLSTVFQTGGSLLFASDAGAKTEVTVFFKRTDNFREFKDQFRFISTQFYF